MEFKKGDLVKCIHASSTAYLEKNKIYTVLDIHYDEVYVKTDRRSKFYYDACYFELAKLEIDELEIF